MITKELLSKVRQIQIKTKRLVNDVLGGEYRSSFKGRGMEFEEVREYLPGDEIRDIDWNVTARTGVPFIKRYREERELVVMLVVDVSQSANFGTKNKLKSDIENELCAVLAFSAIKNNDKVGLIMFSDKVEKFIPPRKGRTHVLRVIRELLYSYEENHKTVEKKQTFPKALLNHIKGVINSFKYTKQDEETRKTNIGGALDYLNRVTEKKSVVFLLSDFMGTGYEEKLKLTNKKHDLVAIITEDPVEKLLPDNIPAMIELEDAETGKLLEVDFGSKTVRDSYKAEIKKKRDKREKFFKKASIDSIQISTGEDYTKEILKFFKMRESRR